MFCALHSPALKTTVPPPIISAHNVKTPITTQGLSEDFLEHYRIKLAKNRRGHITEVDIRYNRTSGKMREVEEVPLEFASSILNNPVEPSDTTTEENPENNEF